MDFDLKSKPATSKMYETTFMVVPEVSEADYKKVAGKFEKLIKDNGANIINIEHWGQKKLAYSIKNRHSAYYCYVEFTSEGDLIGKLEQEFGYDEQILRYLTVSLDKHAELYNNKRRKGDFAKKDVKKTVEPQTKGR